MAFLVYMPHLAVGTDYRHVLFHLSSRDSNSGPHASITCVLPTNPSSQAAQGHCEDIL